jgi:hypothetical protein
VAGVALVILPFQMGVALYFVSRRFAIHPSDLLGAVRKSAIVAVASAAGSMVTVGLNGFDFDVSPLGFFGAAVGAFAGWSIALVLCQHPLLGQICLAGKGLLSMIGSKQALSDPAK